MSLWENTDEPTQVHGRVPIRRRESPRVTFGRVCSAKPEGRSTSFWDCHMFDAYRLTDAGCCAFCETPCPGRFAGPPGRWSARRLSFRVRRGNLTSA
jgi:hypothetical protein